MPTSAICPCGETCLHLRLKAQIEVRRHLFWRRQRSSALHLIVRATLHTKDKSRESKYSFGFYGPSCFIGFKQKVSNANGFCDLKSKSEAIPMRSIPGQYLLDQYNFKNRYLSEVFPRFIHITKLVCLLAEITDSENLYGTLLRRTRPTPPSLHP